MKKILLFLSFLLMSIGVFGTEYVYTTYTTKFTKGTTNGTDINSQIVGGTTGVSTISSEGSSNFASKVTSSTYCYYQSNGAGIRLAKSGNDGNFTLTLSNALKDSIIYAIVLYASKVSGNTKAVLNVTPTGPAIGGYTTVTNIGNSNLPEYDATNYAANTDNGLAHYKLDTIKVNGKKIETLNFGSVSKGYTMLHAITIVTQTEKITPVSYTITAQSNNTTYGTISLSGNVITGSPKSDYRYASPAYTVTSGTATVSQSGNIFTVTAASDCEITINFEAIPSHTLSSVVTPVGGGTVTLGSVSVLEGSTTTATATPSDGYVFTGWSISGTGASLSDANSNPTTVTMGTTNAKITATFTDASSEDVLFHESFGNNSGSAREWSYSYSVKTGIQNVYENVTEYTVYNAKQSKNTVGKTLSGLINTNADDGHTRDAYIIIGPLNVENYNNLKLSYWWKAAAIGATYYTKLFFKTNSDGEFVEVTGTGDGATSFIEKVYKLPSEAQVSTLYLKIVWRTSNADGVIDEIDLVGSACFDVYNILWKNNCDVYTNGNPTTIFNPCVGIETVPHIPTSIISCADKFIGWAEDEITGNCQHEPNNLFNTPTEFNNLYKNVDGDRNFHAVYASLTGNSSNESFTTVFTSKYWEDINNNWIDVKNGYDFNNVKGVHITSGQTGASAKSKYLYREISSIDILYASSSIENSIDIQVGQNSSVTQYTTKTDDLLTMTFSFSPVQTGQIQMTINCITGKNVDIKSITINYTIYEYKDYETYCTDTLESGTIWSSGVWSLGHIPEHNERAVILKPVNIDIEHAKAKEIIIGQNSSNTGKITIQSKKGLEVQDTISVYDGTTYHPTTPNDLILESSDAGNASLIFNNKNNNQATVCLYSRAKIDNGTWNWQYMGTAMDSLNALYNYYGSWIYRWDESQKWKVVPNGGTMYAWTGYCITQEKPEWYATTGTLVKTDTVRLTVPENSNMVFANSWTAPIHISRFNEETLNIDTLNIYLFNTGSDSTGTGSVSTTNRDAGTYLVVPIKAAKYLDRDSLISSQQGFFVKTTREGKITLIYDTLVRTNGSGNIIAGPMLAPKRKILNDEPNILKIYANGSKFGDRLTILEREDFSIGFDNGWDGDKMSFSDVAPSIYVINQDGSYDEVSAIPDYEGTVLGFKSGSDSIYTITFEYDGENEWYLNDLTTLTSTLIGNDSKYIFTHDSENDVRFIISATPYAGVATDIDKVSDGENSVHKYLHNGNLYIIKNNRIFNAIGSLIQ